MFGILDRIRNFFKDSPDLKFIAEQLRKPSGDFADNIGSKMNSVNEPLFDLTLDTMQPGSGEKILEIGSGTGKYIDRLFTASDNLRVCAVDHSSEMIRTTRQNNREAIDTGRLEVELAQSNDLPFPDAYFDKVFCNMVVYFWDDPELHLSEVQRVLTEGGIFYTGVRTRKSMLVFSFVEHGFRLYTIEAWKDFLREQGFGNIEVRSRRDPAINIDGNQISLESCCIAAVNEA